MGYKSVYQLSVGIADQEKRELLSDIIFIQIQQATGPNGPGTHLKTLYKGLKSCVLNVLENTTPL